MIDIVEDVTAPVFSAPAWNTAYTGIFPVTNPAKPAITVNERHIDAGAGDIGLAHGVPAGTLLGRFSATDTSSVTYSIQGGPQIGGVDIFRFGDGDDSTDDDDQLQLNLALNYEDAVSFMGTTQRGYDLTIKATDAAGNSATQDVRIVVNNLQEGPAVFAPLTSDGILESPKVGDILTFNPTPTTSDPMAIYYPRTDTCLYGCVLIQIAFDLPNGEQN